MFTIAKCLITLCLIELNEKTMAILSFIVFSVVEESMFVSMKKEIISIVSTQSIRNEEEDLIVKMKVEHNLYELYTSWSHVSPEECYLFVATLDAFFSSAGGVGYPAVSGQPAVLALGCVRTSRHREKPDAIEVRGNTRHVTGTIFRGLCNVCCRCLGG